jgi:hypothetical protein
MKSVTRHVLIACLATALTGLAGCEISGSDDNSEATLIQGRAAVGVPMVGATIDIKDANGQQFRVYSNGSGYFALVLDSEADNFEDLAAPIIVRATNNEDVYHSVLCNIVYGEFDSVNVHPVTEYVMNQTASADTAYALWETTGKTGYCNAAFAHNFRATASTLGTTFNFFNSAFDADGTGFDAILDSFNPATFTPVDAADDFHIQNGLGSLVVIPGTIWSSTASGTFDGQAYDDSRTAEITVTAEGLRNLIDTLLEEETAQDVEIKSLVITLEGDGTGEEGTSVLANLKGKADAGSITRSFNITVDLERIADVP